MSTLGVQQRKEVSPSIEIKEAKNEPKKLLENQLARCYKPGKNIFTALNYLDEIIKKGEPKELVLQAQEEIDKTLKEAESGTSVMQYAVANWYGEKGEHVQAFKWCKESAENKDGGCLVAWASMVDHYTEGYGVEKSFVKAEPWCWKVIFAECKTHEDKDLVQEFKNDYCDFLPNLKNTRRLESQIAFKRCLDAANSKPFRADAWFTLAEHYECGVGTLKDIVIAAECYKKIIAESKDEALRGRASSKLEKLHVPLKEMDPEDLSTWIRDYYYAVANGIGVPRDLFSPDINDIARAKNKTKTALYNQYKLLSIFEHRKEAKAELYDIACTTALSKKDFQFNAVRMCYSIELGFYSRPTNKARESKSDHSKVEPNKLDLQSLQLGNDMADAEMKGDKKKRIPRGAFTFELR